MSDSNSGAAQTMPFQVGSDIDAQETREWMDALSAVMPPRTRTTSHKVLFALTL